MSDLLNPPETFLLDESRSRWKIRCPNCARSWHPSKSAGQSPCAGATCCPYCGRDTADLLDALRDRSDTQPTEVECSGGEQA